MRVSTPDICDHPKIGYSSWEYFDYPAQFVATENGVDYYEPSYSDGELCDIKDSRLYCMTCNATIKGEIE